MNKVFRLICIVICTLVSLNVLAATEITVGYLKYSVSGNNATVIGYVEEDLPKDLVIPETIEYNGLTFNVTTINGSAFHDCKIIETLTLPESVTSIAGRNSQIGYGAFYNCSNLKNVILKSIVSIGSYAFYGCNQLKWIDFGEKLQTIYSYAFCNCSSLTYLVFPPTISSIETNYYNSPSFQNCDFIQAAIYLGDKVISTGLSNISTFTRKNFISWNANEYTYTGKEIEPEYTNNLPFKFKPSDAIVLEKNVGKYTTTGPVTFSNYDMSFTVEIPYNYTITPATVTASVKDATKVYGDANPEFEAEFSGFVSGEDESVLTNKGWYSTNATQKSGVGEYTITLDKMEAPNYAFQYEEGKLTVIKAPLTISTGDYTIKQGESLPEFVATYDGFKNGETEQVLKTLPTFNCELTNTDVIGEYPIAISGAEGDNYDIQYTIGKLTIEKNTNQYKLSYMIDGEEYKSYDIVYGEAITPEENPTKNGFSFSGWSEIPEKMPAHDVVITGSYVKNAIGKCATPTINIDGGKLSFSCETEDVEFFYEITNKDSKEGSGTEVELTNSYEITVYAAKKDYENSDIAKAEIQIKGGGDLNNDGVINAADVVKLVNIIMGE